MARARAVVACAPCMPHMTAQEEKDKFVRGYGFNKKPPARSPVTGYEYDWAMKGDHPYMPKKEITLIKGNPHKFKGRRSGSIYGNKHSGRNKTR